VALTNTDFVQLPVDSTGKKTAMKQQTIGGATIYIPASVVYSEDGATAAGVAAPADALAAQNGLGVLAQLELFNGTNFDRGRSIDGLDAAPNVRTGVLAAGIGPGFDIKFNPANLATATNSAITNTFDGADAVTYAIGTSTTGTFTFEVSYDDTTWVAAPNVLNPLTGAVVSGNITPTSGNLYQVLSAGARQVRIRTVTTLGATVAVKTTHSLGVDLFQGPADATTSAVGMTTVAQNEGFNGTTWDRQRTLDAFKTAAASPDVGLIASSPADRRFTSQALGTVVGNTTTWDINGAVDAIVTVTTTRTGTMIFEVSNDGTNWVTAEVYDGAIDAWIPGAVTPTAAKNYRIITAGFRTLRARTVTTLSGDPGLVATLSSTPALVRAIDTGPAPHQFGYAQVNKTAQFTTTQTSTTLSATIASTQFAVVTYVQIQVGGTTAGALQIYFGTGAYTRGTNSAVFDGEFAPSSTLKPGVIIEPTNGLRGALDEELKVTTSAALNPLTITVWYYIVG
jgi:hypothetical protein